MNANIFVFIAELPNILHPLIQIQICKSTNFLYYDVHFITFSNNQMQVHEFSIIIHSFLLAISIYVELNLILM